MDFHFVTTVGDLATKDRTVQLNYRTGLQETKDSIIQTEIRVLLFRKRKKQEQAKASAATMAPMGMQLPVQQQQQLWHYNPWPQHISSATLHQPQQTTQDNTQFRQPQLGPIGSHMQDFQHKSAPTNMTQRQHPMSNPCPYPTCHAILTDYNQTQEHMNQFHTIPTLARGPGAEQ